MPDKIALAKRPIIAYFQQISLSKGRDVCLTLIRARKLLKGIYCSKAKFLSHYMQKRCQFS